MRNLPKYLLTIIAIIAVKLLSAQADVIQSSNIETYYEETLWGPKKQHYAHYFVRYGMAVPINKKIDEKPALGGTWAAGVSYKLQLLPIWDLGIDIAYENEWHRLVKTNQLRSMGTDLIIEDISRSFQNNVIGGIFTRFYFNNSKDNEFGAYVDIGAYYSIVARYGLVEKKNDNDERVFIRTKHPSYLNNKNYGLYMRLGYNQFALFARYNMVDIFNDGSFDITPLSIGLQMNLVMF